MITFLRNKLFDYGIIPSEQFNLPVICVGNLSYGGTGKTPHIEYLVRLLSKHFQVATLSRGYGRSTKGFLLALSESTYLDIGDESLQFKNKFPDIQVAVDAKRRRGISILAESNPDLDVVLLDDGFQHRYVKAGLNILLTDFHNLYTSDYVIPTGTLREFRMGSKRADIIIVTKTEKVFSPLTRRRINDIIKPRDHQHLFYSYIKYGKLVSIHNPSEQESVCKVNTIVLFTGIANGYPLQEHVKKMCQELVVLNFPDHHKYSEKDIQRILQAYKDVFSKNKLIITTEKDAMRLIKTNLVNEFKDLPLFYIPIEIKLHKEDAREFDKLIFDYVKKNRRNQALYSETDKAQS